MKKYVSSLLKTTCVLIVMVNAYIYSLVIMKTDEKEYSKIDNFAYVYSVTESQNVEQIKKDEVKTEEPTKNSTSTETPKEEKTETPTINNDTTTNETTDISSYPALETFVGSITGYGPDCYGCSGSGNTSSGYNIKNTIYYNDPTYGDLRILAADKSFPIGTIFRISGLKVYDKPFLAIVLDRGGAITGTKMDLAFLSESDPTVSQIGLSRNITYELLKYGTGKI